MPPKKGKKGKQDDYWDNEFEKDAELLAEGSEVQAEVQAEAPAEEESGLMAMINRKKTKKEPKVQPLVEEPEFTVKSKKEKEREKKEKLKEAKKKAALERKAAVEEKPEPAVSKPQKPVEAPKPEPEAEPEQANEEEEEKGDSKKKKKKKKGAAEVKKEEPVKAKGKPPVAALRKRLEAQKQAEEEERKRQEEERRLIEEEERKIREEEERKEELKRLKKEKEKAKREQLKKEGKLLSKTQREAQQRAQRNLQVLLESGVKIAGLEETKEGASKQKVVYKSKKKKKKQAAEEAKEEEVEEKVEEKIEEEVEEEVKKDTEESLENEATKDQEESDGVKDAWDDSSEEEKEEEEVKPEEEDKSSKESSSSGSEDSSDEDSSEEEKSATQKMVEQRKKEATKRREKRQEDAMAARSKDNLRSPICVILGHVDTGKTKLLDKIRQTNVQEGEAGGITQQIGATYFPIENIKKKTAVILKEQDMEYKLPGLLVIDTPGHESFTNLRSRGSSLCNIAILVVDIMHGLEPQTLESLRLLRDRKTPFIVALNKVDRIYGWEPVPNNGFKDSLSRQPSSAKREFDERVKKTITAFSEQGLNSCLYYENRNFAKYVSLVPTSAISGEGIPDMLHLLIHLTQTRMSDKLMYISELEATVLEVKVIEGFGTTIDVILSNGVLNEGDRIIICGLNGPIATNIRALLTPQPLRELRIKSQYVHHKSIKAAMGIKISAPGLDNAIAGSRLLVVRDDDDEEELMDEVMSDLANLQNFLDKSGRGVSVQASTLGSLEALLEFLRVSKIPVSIINIGPVHKKDVIKCSTMLERAKEFAVMLCFDVKIEKEAQELAEEFGVRIFKADIIYHLFDQFTAYNKDIVEQKRKDQAPQAIFPCVLKIIPGCIFNKRDPIILGVDILDGVLRQNTPVCVVNVDPLTKKREIISLGRVTSIEQNHKAIDSVKKGQGGGGVAIKIECPNYETPKMAGRHFTEQNEVYSHITRVSIDVLKDSFRNDLSKEEWALVVKLKKVLDIQ